MYVSRELNKRKKHHQNARKNRGQRKGLYGKKGIGK